MSSEKDLIERVRRKFPLKVGISRTGIRVGIGDDAAVLRPRAGAEWVVTTDAFLEGVHFLRNIHAPDIVGYKALARATSDLAAMGARPRYFLLSLALPDSYTGKWLDNFLAGMARASRQFSLESYRLDLIGGDTTKYPSILVNLTVIGEVDRGKALLRSGARPGDSICVSGRLGEAELGWQIVQRGLHKKKQWKSLLSKHLGPQPRLAVGQWLVRYECVTAMIDTSDGLSTDLTHICKASGAGARVFAEKIPLVGLPPGLNKLGLDPLRLALDGGEDYELLFTVPKRLVANLPAKVGGVPITIIGEITSEKKVRLVYSGDQGERITALEPHGWDPFRKSAKQNSRIHS